MYNKHPIIHSSQTLISIVTPVPSTAHKNIRAVNPPSHYVSILRFPKSSVDAQLSGASMSYTHFQNWIYKASTTHYIGSGAPSSIGTAIDVSVTLTNLRLSMKIQRIDFVSGEVKLQVKNFHTI